MAFKSYTKLRGDDHELEGEGQPVQPISQSLYLPPMAACINVLFEFEESITEISRAKKNMADALLPRNPLFSCIAKEDNKGVLRWQRTTVNVDDHVFVPEFPPGEESYDDWVDDYISKLALKPLDQSRPLWEFHLLNYKTSKAGATLIVKIHHSLGDGISFMSTLFTMASRADNPDLPPTFPSIRRSYTTSMASPKQSIAAIFYQTLWYFILLLWYTIVDVISSLLRTTGWIDDSPLPIRGPPGVEHMPTALSSATIHLEDIRQIKDNLGGTVNDVITGVIFYGIQRYLQIRLSAVGEQSLQDAYEKRFEPLKDIVINQMKKARITALCLLNTRVMAGLQSIDEMLNPKSQAPWGNYFGFLHVPVPLTGKVDDPLEFVRKAKCIIDRHKMSLGVFINAKILRYLAKLKGPQVTSISLYNTVANSTMVISNMIGPMEKIAIEGNAVKDFSFFVSGAPMSLYISILSYMGTIKIQVMGTKPYIDAHMLSKCFTEAFEEIKEASIIRNCERKNLKEI